MFNFIMIMMMPKLMIMKLSSKGDGISRLDGNNETRMLSVNYPHYAVLQRVIMLSEHQHQQRNN